MTAARGPIEPEEAVSAIRSGDAVMVREFGLVRALVYAARGDELGNLWYRHTQE